MKNNLKKIDPNDWLGDLPTRTENAAFDAKQLIGCGKCARQNPPNRLNCLYCGNDLEISDLQNDFIKPVQRKLENWEKGFNLIRLSNSEIIDFSKAADFTNLETENLREICQTDKKLPLVRLESEKAARIVQKNLIGCGIETLLLSDETLAADKPNSRLRGIEFYQNEIILILFNQDEIYKIALENIKAIVIGVLFEKKVDSKEKRVKKGENKILEAAEISSDEILIDIYDKENPFGFRVLSKGFDFSCLGAEKKILAFENMKTLAEKLREIAPGAKFSDEYKKDREFLGKIWDVGYHSSTNLKKEGFGRLKIESSATTNNLPQFDKYSRLQWFIK